MTRRVLHVVGAMGVGGIENWLFDVFRRTDRSRVAMDFLVNADLDSEHVGQIEALGGRVIVGPSHRDRVRYLAHLRRVIRDARYDVVHSHLDHFSGIVLAVAASARVPVRIAHAHVGPSVDGYPLPRRLYRAVMKQLIAASATHLVACSRSAATNLFGARRTRDARCSIVHYGIELRSGRKPVARDELAQRVDVPARSTIVGSAVRFAPEKNLMRWVDIAAAVARAGSDAYFVLAGNGPEMATVRRRVDDQGLGERFRFLGVRADVDVLLAALFDVVLLPSRYEGLPLLLIEAQAAGVPAVCSTAVSDEVVAIPDLIRRLPLDASDDAWADAVVQITSNRIESDEARAALRGGTFDIETSVAKLLALYEKDGPSS